MRAEPVDEKLRKQIKLATTSNKNEQQHDKNDAEF
jgi:hypothetical protein